MKLWIEGVDERELQFGLAAAQRVLTERGVSPFEGAAAWFQVEGEREDLSDEEHRAAEAWCDAHDAAALVCCGQKAHAVRLTLELSTTSDGEIWVGQRPNGQWCWEALIDRRPEGRLKRSSGECSGESEAQLAARSALLTLIQISI